jgi:gas vesicle protein
MTTEILLEIAKGGGVVGILVACVIYFMKRETKREKEFKDLQEKKDAAIESLQKEMREEAKNSFTVVFKLTNIIEKIEENLKDNKDDILKSIESLKIELKEHLKDLKDAK